MILAKDINVSKEERAISLVLGGILLWRSLSGKKSIPTGLLAGYLFYRGATGNCAAYSALGKTKPNNESRNVNIQLNEIINKPLPEVYDFWRNLENLPLFMEHLESVEMLNESISLWSAKIPGGLGKLRWKSEVVEDRPFEILGWRSLSGSSIRNAGKVEFEDLDGRTAIHVVISYEAPGGLPGEAAARLLNPYFARVVEEDIKRFKWFIEQTDSRPPGLQ